MYRTVLDRQLADLSVAVTDMGQRVDTAIVQSIAALTHANPNLALTVSAADDQIGRERRRILDMSAILITLHQPALGDLRGALGAIMVAEDLEHISDQARTIAELAGRLATLRRPEDTLLQGLTRLALRARRHVQEALSVYQTHNAPEADLIWAQDDEIDQLYASFVTNCMRAMRQNPDLITTHTYLLWIARSLERMADQASSICERVVYVATGQQQMVEAQAITTREEHPLPQPAAPTAQGMAEIAPARREKPVRQTVPVAPLAPRGFQPRLALRRLRLAFQDAMQVVMQALQAGMPIAG